MRRIALLLLLWVLNAGADALAQQLFSLHLSGRGAFGINSQNLTSGTGETGYRDLGTELSLDAGGFVYHPQLLLYSLTASFNRNGIAQDGRGVVARGIGLSGGLSFFSQREFPVTFYFLRGTQESGGSFVPGQTSRTGSMGIRGSLNYRRIALINYDVGISNVQYVWDGLRYDTRQKIANFTAQRSWKGWDFRLNENYNRTKTHSISREQTIKILDFGATRVFRESKRLDLRASRFGYNLADSSGSQSSDSAVTTVGGSLEWKHSPRLDSHYHASITNNAVNTVGLLVGATGVPNPGLPLRAQAVSSTSRTAGATVSSRPTSSLSFSGSVRYVGNMFPGAADGKSLGQLISRQLTTDAHASYRRQVWKLEYQGSGSVQWQLFSLRSGGTARGTGWSVSNGISGGSERAVRFHLGHSFRNTSGAVFFNIITNREHRVDASLETTRLRFLRLQASAEIARGYQRWVDSVQRLSTANYMVVGTRGKLSLSAAHTVSDSNQLLFGPDSLLFQPGGSIGALPIPPNLFMPVVFLRTVTNSAAATWEPRPKLRLNSRYLRFSYALAGREPFENLNWQWQTDAEYKFGRFTLTGGYIKGGFETRGLLQHANRIYFRVQFPFKVL